MATNKNAQVITWNNMIDDPFIQKELKKFKIKFKVIPGDDPFSDRFTNTVVYKGKEKDLVKALNFVHGYEGKTLKGIKKWMENDEEHEHIDFRFKFTNGNKRNTNKTTKFRR